MSKRSFCSRPFGRHLKAGTTVSELVVIGGTNTKFYIPDLVSTEELQPINKYCCSMLFLRTLSTGHVRPIPMTTSTPDHVRPLQPQASGQNVDEQILG